MCCSIRLRWTRRRVSRGARRATRTSVQTGMHIAAVAPDSRGPGHEECSISDTTPNDGKKNPETDAPATTPGLNEPDVDYDAAATPAVTGDVASIPAEPEAFTGTGSHGTLPMESPSEPVAADTAKRATYQPSASSPWLKQQTTAQIAA